MSTIHQLLKSKRISQKKKSLVPALEQCPMKKATVIRTFEQAPKKPNSARRKVARVKIKSSGRLVTCHIPGEGHNLTKHSTVMIRGGRCQDLIGVRYKPIRGLFSFEPLHSRVTRKSKYGVKTKRK
jgi:small subunit ribosomal protein S12